MSDIPAPRLSPLHDVHVAAGASFTDFAGWQMPVRYSSDLAEHHAVRNAAGIFDLSHMAEFLIAGTHAAAFLDYALAGKLSAIDTWQAKYSLLLHPSGGIVDDVVVYRFDVDSFLLVANASNRDAVSAALAERCAEYDVLVKDVSDDYALIAVQGPDARAILEQTPEISDLRQPLSELRYYRGTDASFGDIPLFVARTGYTGEDGFELYIAALHAPALWRSLVVAGEAYDLVPAGLAARDTLRLEAGMPLYGHELSLDILPAQAGLGRVVALGKELDFVGRTAVEVEAPRDARVLVGIAADGKRAARAGYPVLSAGAVVGEVTSGALSPTLGHPIAMAYVDPALATPGTTVDLDVRGTPVPATVVPLPFYSRKASS